ncbi:MAG: hypothetical protein LBS35_02490 [Synergistaceae bacterium]|jgi:hypothetical protein|nr:hypothetical protein [Synergistaceae bacterium]
MSEDRDNLSSDEKEERGPILATMTDLAPLVAVILQLIELILKLLGVIQ